MLAQSFQSADQLGITEPQKDALIKTLVLLETGKLRYFSLDQVSFRGDGEPAFSGDFNMGTFGTEHECGTVACIAGTATLISGVRFCGENRPPALHELFYGGAESDCDLDAITPAQAAVALRSYLTTGDARWDLAVAHA